MKKQDYSKELEQIVDNTRYIKIPLNEEMKKMEPYAVFLVLAHCLIFLLQNCFNIVNCV